MRVENQVQANQGIKNPQNVAKNTEAEVKAKGQENALEEKANQPAAVYEKGVVEKKAAAYSPLSIKELQAQSQKANQMLIDLVDNLLSKQGKTRKFLTEGEMIDIDPETRAKAQEMISEKGPMGIEAVSDRIASFAINMSGENIEKLGELKELIQKGYDKAKEAFGGWLPEISEKTLARTFEKLDAWANSPVEESAKVEEK